MKEVNKSYIPSMTHQSASSFSERGAIIVWFALLLTVLISAGILAIDVSRNAVSVRQIQNCAERSALAGANFLRGSRISVKNAKHAALSAFRECSIHGAMNMMASTVRVKADNVSDLDDQLGARYANPKRHGAVFEFAPAGTPDGDGEIKVTIERGTYWSRNQPGAPGRVLSFRSFENLGPDKKLNNLDLWLTINAVKVTIDYEGIQPVFASIFNSVAGRPAKRSAVAVMDREIEQCVAPFAIPACALLLDTNPNRAQAYRTTDYSAQSQCSRELVFTEADPAEDSSATWITSGPIFDKISAKYGGETDVTELRKIMLRRGGDSIDDMLALLSKRGRRLDGMVRSDYYPRQQMRTMNSGNICFNPHADVDLSAGKFPNCKSLPLRGVMGVPEVSLTGGASDQGAVADAIIKIISENSGSTRTDRQCFKARLGDRFVTLEDHDTYEQKVLENEDLINGLRSTLRNSGLKFIDVFENSSKEVTRPFKPRANFPFLRTGEAIPYKCLPIVGNNTGNKRGVDSGDTHLPTGSGDYDIDDCAPGTIRVPSFVTTLDMTPRGTKSLHETAANLRVFWPATHGDVEAAMYLGNNRYSDWTNPMCHDPVVPFNDRDNANAAEMVIPVIAPKQRVRADGTIGASFEYCDYEAAFDNTGSMSNPPNNGSEPVIVGFVKAYMFDFNLLDYDKMFPVPKAEAPWPTNEADANDLAGNIQYYAWAGTPEEPVNYINNPITYGEYWYRHQRKKFDERWRHIIDENDVESKNLVKKPRTATPIWQDKLDLSREEIRGDNPAAVDPETLFADRRNDLDKAINQYVDDARSTTCCTKCLETGNFMRRECSEQNKVMKVVTSCPVMPSLIGKDCSGSNFLPAYQYYNPSIPLNLISTSDTDLRAQVRAAGIADSAIRIQFHRCGCQWNDELDSDELKKIPEDSRPSCGCDDTSDKMPPPPGIYMDLAECFDVPPGLTYSNFAEGIEDPDSFSSIEDFLKAWEDLLASTTPITPLPGGDTPYGVSPPTGPGGTPAKELWVKRDSFGLALKNNHCLPKKHDDRWPITKFKSWEPARPRMAGFGCGGVRARLSCTPEPFGSAKTVYDMQPALVDDRVQIP